MKVEVKFDSKRALNNIRKIQRQMPGVLTKALRATAQFGVQVIQDRTEKGVGYEGRFKAYSAQYRKAKSAGWPASKAGSKSFRPAFSGDTTGVVNLNVTGKMLGSMSSRSLGFNKAEIYFTRPTEGKKAAFNQEIRPFVGFNNSEKQRLKKFFNKQIEKARIK